MGLRFSPQSWRGWCVWAPTNLAWPTATKLVRLYLTVPPALAVLAILTVLPVLDPVPSLRTCTNLYHLYHLHPDCTQLSAPSSTAVCTWRSMAHNISSWSMVLMNGSRKPEMTWAPSCSTVARFGGAPAIPTPQQAQATQLYTNSICLSWHPVPYTSML